MKLFIFAMIMILGMGNVMGQYEIAFKNDSGQWVAGYQNPTYNFKDITISGIGGDTIWAKLINQDDVNSTVSAYYVIENMNTSPYTCDTLLFQDSIFYVLPADTVEFVSMPINIHAYSDVSCLIEITTATVFPKFFPPTLNLQAIPVNKSTYDVGDVILTLSDFGLYVNLSGGGYSAKFDTIYCLYSDTGLIYQIADTTFTITENGNYYVQAIVLYTTGSSSSGTFTFERPVHSNIVNVMNVSIIDNQEKANFNIYPNPATDYLYFSEEIEYTVFSITGKKVLKGVGKEINVQDFDSGVYILSTLFGNVKFIVQ